MAVIGAAQTRGLGVVTTNSDGSPERRALLLSRLGPGATELVVDPGIEIVTERLSVNGTLDPQCKAAIQRWTGGWGRCNGSTSIRGSPSGRPHQGVPGQADGDASRLRGTRP